MRIPSTITHINYCNSPLYPATQSKQVLNYLTLFHPMTSWLCSPVIRAASWRELRSPNCPVGFFPMTLYHTAPTCGLSRTDQVQLRRDLSWRSALSLKSVNIVIRRLRTWMLLILIPFCGLFAKWLETTNLPTRDSPLVQRFVGNCWFKMFLLSIY